MNNLWREKRRNKNNKTHGQRFMLTTFGHVISRHLNIITIHKIRIISLAEGGLSQTRTNDRWFVLYSIRRISTNYASLGLGTHTRTPGGKKLTDFCFDFSILTLWISIQVVVFAAGVSIRWYFKILIGRLMRCMLNNGSIKLFFLGIQLVWICFKISLQTTVII